MSIAKFPFQGFLLINTLLGRVVPPLSSSKSRATAFSVSRAFHQAHLRVERGTPKPPFRGSCCETPGGGSASLHFGRGKEKMTPSSLMASTLLSPPSSMPNVMGDADLCFYRGIELEKGGQARAASAAFHEAATLYQCFLDQEESEGVGGAAAGRSNEFRHVTSLNPDDGNGGCKSVLAYACVRLAHLCHDALGDSKAATRLYKEAASIDPSPSSISYDGIGTSIEASGGDLSEAVNAYRAALRLAPNNREVSFHLAVALERLGQVDEANSIMDSLRQGEAEENCLVDSWGYVRWHTRRVQPDELNLYRGTRAMHQIALDAAMDFILEADGLVCEFGVGSGRSMRMLQEMLPLNIPIHGFDTFTGLPQAWGDEPAGAYSTGGNIPQMEGDVTFHKGLFKETIPAFLSTTKPYQPLAFANIDCDLHSSTLDVLEAMHGRVVPGTIIVFDEYLCHPTWRQDEFRAWRECCKRFGWHYEYLGFSLSSKQAVVRVTE